jgi:hypothetical protein
MAAALLFDKRFAVAEVLAVREGSGRRGGRLGGIEEGGGGDDLEDDITTFANAPLSNDKDGKSNILSVGTNIRSLAILAGLSKEETSEIMGLLYSASQKQTTNYDPSNGNNPFKSRFGNDDNTSTNSRNFNASTSKTQFHIKNLKRGSNQSSLNKASPAPTTTVTTVVPAANDVPVQPLPTKSPNALEKIPSTSSFSEEKFIENTFTSKPSSAVAQELTKSFPTSLPPPPSTTTAPTTTNEQKPLLSRRLSRHSFSFYEEKSNLPTDVKSLIQLANAQASAVSPPPPSAPVTSPGSSNGNKLSPPSALSKTKSSLAGLFKQNEDSTQPTSSEDKTSPAGGSGNLPDKIKQKVLSIDSNAPPLASPKGKGKISFSPKLTNIFENSEIVTEYMAPSPSQTPTPSIPNSTTTVNDPSEKPIGSLKDKKNMLAGLLAKNFAMR